MVKLLKSLPVMDPGSPSSKGLYSDLQTSPAAAAKSGLKYLGEKTMKRILGENLLADPQDHTLVDWKGVLMKDLLCRRCVELMDRFSLSGAHYWGGWGRYVEQGDGGYRGHFHIQ